MQYVRLIDYDSAEISGEAGYKGKVLYRGETCMLIATRIPVGARGPQNPMLYRIPTHHLCQHWNMIERETESWIDQDSGRSSSSTMADLVRSRTLA